MKYRQWKKNYKKKYGYNPPSKRQQYAASSEVYKAYGLTPEQAAAALQQLAKNIKPAMALFVEMWAAAVESYAEALKSIAKGLREEREDIKA